MLNRYGISFDSPKTSIFANPIRSDNVMPIIPVLFLLLAFVWQAVVSF
ncbi:hypothetical protein KP509_12G056200 [Ceratopteris richardii]|uniref:Photosystem II protein K n=1 Tax=Ceratopteris richardii TaxID=49495 RepID=A0A8T2TSD5_CERRI|nr:hypothetical protein KP509_12G056200 [Ceratopteris richardii]